MQHLAELTRARAAPTRVQNLQSKAEFNAEEKHQRGKGSKKRPFAEGL